MANNGAKEGGPGAYATLLTNDGYVTAALVMAKSLRGTSPSYPLVAVITPDTVSEESRERLRTLFDAIIPKDPITGVSATNLQMIGRPDLGSTLTKLHFWALTQYERVLYLDADTLVLRNLDHLFSLPDSVTFAASPELGFPDCFNAGLMLLTPDERTFGELALLARSHESFDGGDQGLLNVFFGDGPRGHPVKEFLAGRSPQEGGRVEEKETMAATSTPGAPSRKWFRLSFTYNMEMHAVYRLYIPAVLRYRDEHKVLHFIGKDKPWHFAEGKLDKPEGANAYFDFYSEMIGRWWDVKRSLEDV